MSSLLPSLVRTVVPLIVGWLLSWPVTQSLGVTEPQVTAAVTAAVTALYYLAARVIEAYAPRVGAILVGLGIPAPSYRAVDGRHELGRDGDHGDTGGARVAVVLVVAVLSVAALAAVPASASGGHRPRVVVAPKVEHTRLCGDVLEVDWEALRLDGRDWRAWLDDGTAVLEAHEVSGRSGPGGLWAPVEYAADGGSREGTLRWPGYGRSDWYGQHWAQVRVVVAGYRSPDMPITEEACA